MSVDLVGSGAAVGDGKLNTAGAITQGTATLTASSAANFQVGDQGKYIIVRGAGVAGADLATTILTRNSATSVTLAANASSTVSGAVVLWGTDNYSGINSAFSAVATSGSPSGERFDLRSDGLCLCSQGFQMNGQNFELVGQGASGDSISHGVGSSVLVFGPNQTGFTFFAGSSAKYQGPQLRNLHLVGSSGSGLGWLGQRVNDGATYNLTISDFGGGGFKLDGVGGTCQGWNVYAPRVVNCGGYSIDTANTNELNIYGGRVYTDNANAPTAGTYGYRAGSTANVSRLHGTVFVGFQSAIQVAGRGHEFYGVHVEGWDPSTGYAVDVQSTATWTQWYGGLISNSLAGATGTAFNVAAGALDTLLAPNQITGITARFADAGTRTIRQWRGRYTATDGIVLQQKTGPYTDADFLTNSGNALPTSQFMIVGADQANKLLVVRWADGTYGSIPVAPFAEGIV